VFIKYELEGGWFCTYGKEGKKNLTHFFINYPDVVSCQLEPPLFHRQLQ